MYFVLIATNLLIIRMLHPSMNKKEKTCDLKQADWVIVNYIISNNWMKILDALFLQCQTHVYKHNICTRVYTHIENICIWKYLNFCLVLYQNFCIL